MSDVIAPQRRPRGRPQVRSDEATRHLIAEAARGAFIASGYSAANMDCVAKNADVSKKTLYRLFPTKAELFRASIADRIDSFILALDEERLAILPPDEQRHTDAVILNDLGAHLAAGALAHAENVLDLLGFERRHGVGADHAAIGDDAGPGDVEAIAQTAHHRQQHRHVGGVVRHQERGDRPVGVIHHDAEHDLLQVPSVVLGMAALTQVLTAGALEP